MLHEKALPLFCKYEEQRADVLFILEAPNERDTTVHGYLSYDKAKTDPTGTFFREMYTEVLNKDLEKLAVTNSVLCLPVAKKVRSKLGRETTTYPVTRPLRENCAEHLRAQVESLDPPLVVTLGLEALKAAGRIEKHGLTKMCEAFAPSRESISRTEPCPRPWFNRTLFPLYHTSLQVRNNRRTGRSPDEQRGDWSKLRELLASKR